ncbi:cell division protein FtsI [Rhodoferax sp. GW822-FHT02A01]|uniref:cell division protein FtsI n=1 Tax=Rhodoferax sp. GW822-FHT02A01 TaxID=3141537 RepID=UPI00315CDCA3
MYKIFALSALCISQTACSIISPIPTWELIKAAGSASSTAIMSRPGEAKNTVYHYHAPFSELCIEYNPQTQVADIVPALQSALRHLNIESRLYETSTVTTKCSIWLKYSALVEWGTPPSSDDFRPYISNAALTLQTSAGMVLSSSNYILDSSFLTSKWATTQDKLGPVVTALITGF